MTKRTRFTINLAIILGFLLLPLALYWDVTIGPNTMLPADNLYQWAPWATHAADFNATTPDNSLISDLMIQNYVWKSFIRESLSNGEIPLWNPHLFGGAPFLATGQNAGYYPFGLIFLILPLTKAYGWYTVSQLWLAGVAMYFYGRVLGMRRASATAAGLIFQGCGFFLVSAAVFPMIIGAAAWLPILLASLDMIIRCNTHSSGAGRTLPWATLGAFALGMQILAGHIEITYYSLIVMAFYALWRLITRLTGREWRRANNFRNTPLFSRQSFNFFVKPVLWLSATVLIGLMLGAIQFVPFYEVGTTNFREGSATLAEVRDWGFPTRRIITWAIPDFFGNPADHTITDAWTGEQTPMRTNYYSALNPHGRFTTNWGIKNYVEGGAYLGILPLILAALGVISVIKKPTGAAKPPRFGSRRSAVGFFVTLSLLSLAFIFGTPLYAILYYGFPGLNQLHSPFRWVFPLSLCVAALAGYGLEYLAQTRMDLEKKEPTRNTQHATPIRILTLWSTPSAVTLLGGTLFWGGLIALIALYLSRTFYGTFEPTIESLFLGLAQAPDAFPNARTFYSYQFTNIRHFILMLIASGIVLRVSRCPIYIPQRIIPNQPVWPFLAALIIFADLLFIGYGFNASVDPALLEFKPDLVRWLEQQPDSDLWRVTSFDNKGDKPFNANSAWLTGFQDIRGYDSIIAKQYAEYMSAIEPQNELQFNRIQPLGDVAAIDSPLIDLLNVKYIITHEELSSFKLGLVWAGEGVNVYENLAVMPRAYIISQDATLLVEEDQALRNMQALDPRFNVIVELPDWVAEPDDRMPINVNQPQLNADFAPAEVVSYSGREVIIRTEAPAPVWLILTDTYFPGWNVFVKPIGTDDPAEIERSIVRVNHNFRGVQLDAGAWEIRFRYSPPTFLIGGLITVMAAIIVLFGFVVWAWRRFYRPEGEINQTRSLAKNSMAPMALNLFNRGIDFCFAAFYLRLLGPADSGSYATAIAIAGLYEILSNFGLNAYLIREVSQSKENAGRYLYNTTILRLGTGALSSLPIFLYLYSTDYGIETVYAVLFIMIGMVLSGMGLGITGLFYAFEEAEVPAAVTTVTTIMKVAFGVIVLLIGYGFVGLAAVSIIVNTITLIILVTLAVRRYPLSGPWRIDFPLQKAMIVQSYPLMLNHLLATVYWQVDVLILREINGEEVVGWYNSAYKYVNALNVIPSFFTFALFPIIARQVQTSIDDARRTFRMSAKILMLVALPLAASVTIMAPLMIQLLGGAAFLPHGYIALQVVIWSIPFGWLNSVTNYVLISLGQERLQTRAFIIGVGFNVVGNLLLLPRFSYVGAGLTTIVSEIVLLLIFNYYLVQKMPNVQWIQLLWRPVAITAVMVAVMVALAPLNMWLSLFVGLTLYPAGLYLLNVFGEDEQRILKNLLPAKLATRLRLT